MSDERPYGDYTGRVAAAAVEERDAAQAEAAERLTMVREVQRVRDLTEVVDVTGPDPVVLEPDPREEEQDQALVEELAESKDPKVLAVLKRFVALKSSEEQRNSGALVADEGGAVTVRLNSDVEMTYGKDDATGEMRNYDFKRGRRYRVPRDVAEHLDRVGRLWR